MPTRYRVPLALLGLLSLSAPPAAFAAREAPGPARAAPDGASIYGAFLTGIVAGALGDSEIASDRLLDVSRIDPGDEGVRGQAFVFSTLAGNMQAAALAARLPGNPLSPLVLGNDAARRGDWAGAHRRYDQVAHASLNALLRPLLVAWAQQGAGETDQALDTLAPLTENSPIAGIYAVHAAMIADQADRSDQAARFYQQAFSVYPGSDLVFVQSYASFLDRAGRPAEAKSLVHALMHAVPALSMSEAAIDASLGTMPVATPQQGLARAYFNFAALIQQQGARGHEAEDFMLRFALDLEPGLTPARLLRADLQNAAGSPGQALASLRQVSAADPLYPVASLRMAIIAAGAGDHAEARATLTRLVHSFPGRAEPLQALADVLQDDGRYAASIDAYGRAIRLLSPLDGEDWQILFSRATAYDRSQQWPKAQSDLQHALQLAPNEPFLLNYLGYSWLERKQDLGDARTMIERALDAKPGDASIRDSLGWAMYRQNDIVGAVQQLERAAEQMPEDPTVNYHLGAAYWAAGRKVEARDQWRWALLLHPAKPDAARIRAALRSSMRPGADPVLAADALPLSHP